MKDSFALPDARTVMIATVSPASKDTEHSLSTLRHACLMIGKDGHNGKESESETENEDSATASSAKNNPDRISISNKRSISTNRTMVGNNTKGGKSSVYRGETRPGISFFAYFFPPCILDNYFFLGNKMIDLTLHG